MLIDRFSAPWSKGRSAAQCLLLVLALGAQVAAPAEEVPEKAAAPAGATVSPSSRAGNASDQAPPGAGEAPPPPEEFVPSEKVSPGTAISFPVDI